MFSSCKHALCLVVANIPCLVVANMPCLVVANMPCLVVANMPCTTSLTHASVAGQMKMFHEPVCSRLSCTPGGSP